MTTYSPIPGTPFKGPGDEIRLPPTLLRELARALETIRFGTIELVIHDGRVVQLEMREKIRVSPELTQHDR